MPQLAPSMLAHGGPGASWQAVVTIICLGLAVVFVAVVMGWFEVREPGDLLLPVAAVIIIAGLGTGVSETVSDWIGWAIPVGAVVLVAMIIGVTTSLELRPSSPLVWATVVVAVLAAIVLVAPLTESLHPPEDASTAPPTDGG